MKVLIVSQYFWPENFAINALASKLQQRGVEVTVLTGKPNYPDGKIFPGFSAWGTSHSRLDGIEILRLPMVPRGRRSPFRLVLNYLSFILSGTLIAPWLLRDKAFDLVFVFAPSPLLQALPALWIAKLKRVPVVLWVQDLWPESLSATGFVKNAWLLRMVAGVVRFIYRHTDRVLIPSEAFRAPIRAMTDGATPISYYPNPWVAEPVTETSPEVEALLVDMASTFSVVFAGNLGSAQSLDTILDAAELLLKSGAEARIFLVGSGSRSAWLSQEVQKRSLCNVRLPGRFTPASMPALYAAASALLVSLCDDPIFALTIPSKLQGYLAAGRPVIASINGEGARVVMEAGAGIACPAGNACALAAAIQVMQRTEAGRRAEMGDNARRYADLHFSPDKLADDLIDKFGAVVSAHVN